MVQYISPTELLDVKKEYIDRQKPLQALLSMADDHIKGAEAVKNNLKLIKKIVDKIFLRLNDGGCIIYAGAGTSGRIGVQDGVELFPTFGWPKNRVKFFLAGGIESLTSSIENSEDDTEQAILDFNQGLISKKDVVFAIAASGNTPYTCKIASLAKNKKAYVIGVLNNPKGNLLKYCNENIILNTGPEILAGSTRLKAGTSQKICLNIITTFLMTKLGRVKNGQMSHMVVSNKKLKKRKERINNYLK